MVRLMNNDLTIKQADNGYILEYLVDEGSADDPDISMKQIVVEETDDAESDSDMIKLLYAIAEHYGCSYDKFSPNNLEITFTKRGHKVE
jgi:hypothetical protein